MSVTNEEIKAFVRQGLTLGREDAAVRGCLWAVFVAFVRWFVYCAILMGVLTKWPATLPWIVAITAGSVWAQGSMKWDQVDKKLFGKGWWEK